MASMPTVSEVQEVARSIGRECLANNTRPSYAEVARRLGRHNRWLTDGGETVDKLRSAVLREWMLMSVLPPRILQPKEDETPIPDEYPTGDDLFGILNHPGRLHMFCSLAKSGGAGAALTYAQKQYERFYAQPTPQDAA